MGDFYWMREIWFAGATRLGLMMFGCEIVRAPQNFKVVAGPIFADLFQQLGKAEIYSVPGGKANGRIACCSHEETIVNPRGSRKVSGAWAAPQEQ